jgi:hypothetical protein
MINKLYTLILLLFCCFCATAQNKIRIGNGNGSSGGGVTDTTALHNQIAQNTSAIALRIPIANYIVRESPTGTYNSSNVVFNLAHTPVSGKEMVYLNGVLQYLTDDYTISGATLTMVVAPRSTDKIRVTYIY